MRRALVFGLLAAVLACGGRSDPEPIMCGPNAECPPGYVCDPGPRRCTQNGHPDASVPDAP